MPVLPRPFRGQLPGPLVGAGRELASTRAFRRGARPLSPGGWPARRPPAGLRLEQDAVDRHARAVAAGHGVRRGRLETVDEQGARQAESGSWTCASASPCTAMAAGAICSRPIGGMSTEREEPCLGQEDVDHLRGRDCASCRRAVLRHPGREIGGVVDLEERTFARLRVNLEADE